MFVPVVDKNQNPLMPTSPKRARKMIESRKATPFWKRGIFCIRLNTESKKRNLQEIAVGIDPGSKKEGFTIKSKAYTYLNIQTDAVIHVKKRIEVRRILRRNRRYRKSPYRKNKINRSRSGFSPSTKARWGWKLRILNWLRKIFPISVYVVEDIRAWAKKGQKKWNKSFSPLEIGKNWFYQEVEKLGKLIKVQGYQTAEKRNELKLKKLSNKLSDSFYAHCVDSFVLSLLAVGGKEKPDNIQILKVIPLKFHRRQLHVQNFKKGGIRKNYGGTRSLGFKRGSLVKHIKLGLVYIGGTFNDKLSLCSIRTGDRICQSAKHKDIRFLSYCSWRFV